MSVNVAVVDVVSRSSVIRRLETWGARPAVGDQEGQWDS